MQQKSNNEPERTTDMEKISKFLATVITCLGLILGLTACDNANTAPDMSVTEGTTTEMGTGTAAIGTSTYIPTYNEMYPRDNLPEYKAGDHVDEIKASNGAKAYDEMYYDKTIEDLLSHAVVEYKGKITKLVDSSVTIGFSPSGRYFIYIHNDVPGDFDTNATFLYDVATGKNQQLTPYWRTDATTNIPHPDSEDFNKKVRWTENSLSYEALGKTWTLNFTP